MGKAGDGERRAGQERGPEKVCRAGAAHGSEKRCRAGKARGSEKRCRAEAARESEKRCRAEAARGPGTAGQRRTGELLTPFPPDRARAGNCKTKQNKHVGRRKREDPEEARNA